MHDLADRVVVVTGASSGIGRATAERLAGRGTTVIGVARGADGLRALEQFLADAPGRVVTHAADVTDAAALERIAADTVAAFGQLDAWVSAAAVATYGAFEEVPFEEFEQVLRVNVMGVVHGSRAALPHLRASGEGVLVNVSSVLGVFGTPYLSSYVTSKFALRGLAESLRMELRHEPDISVSTVLPSSVDTPFFQHAGVHSDGRPEAPSGAIDAQRVARAITSVLERPRREVVVGVAPRPLLVLHAIAPGAFERLLGPILARDLFTAEPAAGTAGSVFEAADDDRVSGGWPRVNQVVGRTLAAATGVATAVIGAATGARDRDRDRTS